MSELVTNEAVMSCCARPRSECVCDSGATNKAIGSRTPLPLPSTLETIVNERNNVVNAEPVPNHIGRNEANTRGLLIPPTINWNEQE